MASPHVAVAVCVPVTLGVLLVVMFFSYCVFTVAVVEVAALAVAVVSLCRLPVVGEEAIDVVVIIAVIAIVVLLVFAGAALLAVAVAVAVTVCQTQFLKGRPAAYVQLVISC